MAELIRLGIGFGQASRNSSGPLPDAVGKFSSGASNVSTEHDDYLADAHAGLCFSLTRRFREAV